VAGQEEETEGFLKGKRPIQAKEERTARKKPASISSWSLIVY